MQHPDEGIIHAWLDGELSADESRNLESHVADCEECSARVAEARGLIAASSRIVSALDVVPGGVVPPALPRRRAWYSSVQFRAAAGILFVAGASLLLLNRGQPRAAEQVIAESKAAPKSQPAESPMPMLPAEVPESRSPAATSPARAQEARQRSELAQAQRANEIQQSKTADAATGIAAGNAAAAAPAVANASAPTPMPPQAKRILADSSVRLSEVVVTGVATVAESPLTLVSSDTSQVAVKNVYEVRKGVEVTLVEATLPQRNFSASSAQMRKEARPMAAAALPPAAAESDAATNSITWSKGAKVFTLTGMLSRIQLEAIRLKLPEDKR